MAIKLLILLPPPELDPMWCPYFFMPQGRCSETRLSICSRSKVFPTTSSIDSVFWHMLGPSIVPLGRWETESFLAFCFSPRPVREASPLRLQASLCGQNKSYTGGKPQTTQQYLRLTHSLPLCQILHSFPVLIFPFGWLWAIYFVLLCLLYRDYISCCLPNTFDCNAVAFWRKNTRSWQKTKHHSRPGSWITNSPGQSLSFYL